MAANESDQEKTEEPTERRKTDSIEKGQILSSKDFVMGAVLVTGVILFTVFGRTMFSELVGSFRQGLDISSILAQETSLVSVVADRFISAAIIVLAFSFPLAIIAISAQMLIGGIHFIPSNLNFKANRLSIISGFGRMFGSNALIELIKSVLKVIVLGVLGSLLLIQSLPYFVAIASGGLESTIENVGSITLWIFLILVAAVAMLGILDAVIQFYRHKKQLMMTKQEVKDEHKQTEGSPEVRARIRRAQQEISQRSSVSQVEKAQVVLVNPQHFAVALNYDFAEGSAPKVIAKGADVIASQIRERAEAAGIPILTMPLLARALFFTTEIGAEIHADLYRAVAAVLSFVFQAGGTGDPPDVEVPDALQFDANGNRKSHSK
jgi:flagellar biosynthetic protein FlhB